MDRLTGMESFVAVAETGSFSAAGRRLGLTRAVVGKRIAALEQALGVQLLHRTTRQVSITQAGMDFLISSRNILAEFDQAMQVLTKGQSEAEGVIRVSAPMSFGQGHLLPALLEFMKRNPCVLVQLDLTDRFVQVIEESYDLVVRIAAPQDSSLIHRHLTAIHRVVCAAPDYLREHGTPGVPEDILRHRVLNYGRQRSRERWELCGPEGEREVIAPEFAFCANNGDVLAEAAVAGHGLVLLPVFIVGPYLQDGRLVRVLPDYQGTAMDLHALWPANRQLPGRVRMLIDYLVECFGHRQDWLAD